MVTMDPSETTPVEHAVSGAHVDAEQLTADPRYLDGPLDLLRLGIDDGQGVVSDEGCDGFGVGDAGECGGCKKRAGKEAEAHGKISRKAGLSCRHDGYPPGEPLDAAAAKLFVKRIQDGGSRVNLRKAERRLTEAR